MRWIANTVLVLLMGMSVRAQVINPPDLACASTLVNGDVLLTWNLPTNSCGPFVSYDIYASNVGMAGPYALLGSVPVQSTTTYLHAGANGIGVTWHYYMTANHSCSGFTPLSSDTLDNLDPIAPALIRATVVNNVVQLDWQSFISPETFAYIIYRNSGGFNPVDTVYGRNSTQYTDQTSQPTLHPEEYIIAAMDSCGNTGTTTPTSHRTIHLTYAVASCAGYIDLSWTDYQGFTVAAYNVMYSVNGGGFQLAGTLSPGTTTYQLTGFNDNDSLCIYIEGNDGGTVTAWSNMVCFQVSLTQSLQDLLISGLTVLADQSVQLNWQASKADLIKIIVQRSQDGANFNNIKTYTPPFPNPIVMSYNDTTAAADQRSWFYRIVANDSCGDTLITPSVQTVYLDGRARPNFTNTLEWNDPGFANGSVITYAIFLQQGPWSFRGSSFTLDYVDNISDLITTDGNFCYYVEAQGLLALPTGSIPFISASNVRCLKQFATIYAPTAFIPDGVNSFFKPVITFGQPGTYKMSIFNRYGQLIMSTSDPNEAWDGTHNGTPAPMGVYAYLIEVQGPNNKLETKTGTVMLIR